MKKITEIKKVAAKCTVRYNTNALHRVQFDVDQSLRTRIDGTIDPFSTVDRVLAS